MPLDANNNWVPGLTGPDPVAQTGIGSGSPEGVVIGSPPDSYWDRTNNVLYIKDTGSVTKTGWISVSSGGGGGAGGLQGSGSPEGVVTADPGAPYWDSSASTWYVKNSGSGNTDWVLVVQL